MIVNLIIYF